jgi:hypothetical protein
MNEALEGPVNWLLGTAWSVILGVLSSYLVVFLVESQRKPRLTLSIVEPSDQNYPSGRPARIMRSLLVRVRNEELPKWLRWMRRESAQSCSGIVKFMYASDGTALFTEGMPARWASSPELIPLTGTVGSNTPVAIWDPSRLSVISKIDIPAGEQEDLGTVVRCDDEIEAYGFNNESYQFNWRNPKWKLAKGRYLVEVTIRSAGQKACRSFMLNNDLSRDQFRLDPLKGA